MTDADMFMEIVSVIPVGEVFKIIRGGANSGKVLKLSDEQAALLEQKFNKFLKEKICGCFTEATLVLTDKGKKSIKEIKVGNSLRKI